MIKNKLTKSEQVLTKRQEAFVRCLVANGGKQEQAAIEAGYSPKAARVQAYENLRLPHVQAAYKALIWQTLQNGAAAAAMSINDLAARAESEHARLAAANSILDRVGFKQAEQTVAQGVVINLSLGKASDTGATQPITIDGQVIDSSEQSSTNVGDGTSS